MASQILALSGSPVTEVVSGDCPSGVDPIGIQWAKENGLPVKKFPADWNTYRLAAGPIRNKQMAEYADAAVVIWDGKSPGTKNMVDEMGRLGKYTSVHYVDLESHAMEFEDEGQRISNV